MEDTNINHAPIARKKASKKKKRRKVSPPKEDNKSVEGKEEDKKEPEKDESEFYEKIVMKGSVLKRIKHIRISDYSLCLSYDQVFHKYYCLVTGQSGRIILVAQDMTKILEYMKDTLPQRLSFNTQHDLLV